MTTPTEREVLEALWRKVNPQPFNGHIGPSPAWKEWVHARRCFTAMLDAKAYESAALLLVPDGWFTFLASQDRHSRSWVWELRGGYGLRAKARAATHVLALCAAIEAALAREGE